MQDANPEASRHIFASRLNAHSQTDWAIEDQAKNLNSTAGPYDEWAHSPILHHADVYACYKRSQQVPPLPCHQSNNPISSLCIFIRLILASYHWPFRKKTQSVIDLVTQLHNHLPRNYIADCLMKINFHAIWLAVDIFLPISSCHQTTNTRNRYQHLEYKQIRGG